MHTIIYERPIPWKYFLINLLTNEPYSVTEEEFFYAIGYDRSLIPKHYDEKNINKQNFYMDKTIIGYKIRR